MSTVVAAAQPREAAIEEWGIGTYEWDHETGAFLASARCLELYAWSGAPPSGAGAVWETVHPDDREQVRAALAGMLQPGGAGRLDLVHRVVDQHGKLRWLQHRAQTTFEISGGARLAERTLGSVMDVTERVHLQQELRRAETRFEEAVRGAQFGIFEHNHVDDPKAESVYWSPRLREIFGVGDAESHSAATLLSRIHPDDIPALHEAVARAHDPGGDGYYDVEHRYLHPVLGLRWLLTRSSTYFGEVGGKRVPVRTVGAMLDVTARRKLEQEHEQRARVLDATIDLVAMAEPDGSLVYLNRMGRKFLGIGEEEALAGRSLHEVHTPQSLAQLLGEGMPAAIRDGAWQSETKFLRHDAATVPMSQVLLAHRGREGKVVLFSMIARDVSRERQLEENVRQAQKMEAVGRLAGGIAHDFNNMLSAVLSFAHLAAREIGLGGKGYAEQEEIIAAAERAAALTRQLLAFSRKQVLQPCVVDVGEVLTRMGPMIERLMGEHITLRLTLASCPVRVKVDPTHLEQVVMNLAINARDAMQHGGVLTIDCRLTDIDAALGVARGDLSPGRYVVISVSDEGSGMDAETRTRVFEPFFTTKRVGRGTGLGLATVFGIAKQSGGGMHVESELGRGSTFEVYVPSSEEPLTETPRAWQPAPASGATAAGVILVAEDDASVRRGVVTILERAGYEVIAAAGPRDALERAGEYPGDIDLLLTDVVMPVMSGKELAGQLLARRPGLSILYMSGYTDETIVDRGVLNAGVHLLPKPITPERLLAAVGQRLEEKRGSRLGSSNGAAAASEERAVGP